ncbi:MAG: MerR family transcriptional regulator [Nanoarchaeota archaeon]|nr:MerR family transcriptional regulator [Nanoarchaeota archaeon]
MKSFFTPKDVRQFVDITYRQIQYWDKSRFIIPSYRRRGKYRLYTFGDLVLLKVAETLRKNGYSIQELRRTVSNLRDLMNNVTFPFSELNILFNKKKKEGIILFNGEVNATSLDDYVSFSVGKLRESLNDFYEPNKGSGNDGMHKDCAAYMRPITERTGQIKGHMHHKSTMSSENICDIVSNYKI